MRISFFAAISFFLLSFLSVFAQVPVEGDKLLDLLGKREESPAVSSLKSYIGSDYTQKGIQITTDKGTVTRIEIYNDKSPYVQNMQRFSGTMPKGLSFDNTIHQAKQKLGEGFEASGKVGEAYSLLKEFTMGDLDAYEMNLDFQRGRLQVVSLIYKEGGGVAAEETKNVQETGLRGDDFLLMMNKNEYNKMVTKLQEQCGYPNHRDKTTLQYYDDGLAIYFDNMQRIERIVLYGGGQRSDVRPDSVYSAFPLQMPFGVKFSDSRDLIVSKAGQPASTEGSAMLFSPKYADVKIYMKGSTVDRVEVLAREIEKVERKPKPKKQEW